MRFPNIVTVALMATSAASYPIRTPGNAPAPVEGLMGRDAEPQKLKVDKREPQKMKANRREPRKLMIERRRLQKLKVD